MIDNDRKRFTEITLTDTKEVVRLPGSDKDIWAVTVGISKVEKNGDVRDPGSVKQIVYFTRESLERAGMLPKVMVQVEKEKVEDNFKELVLSCLALIGVYPNN